MFQAQSQAKAGRSSGPWTSVGWLGSQGSAKLTHNNLSIISYTPLCKPGSPFHHPFSFSFDPPLLEGLAGVHTLIICESSSTALQSCTRPSGFVSARAWVSSTAVDAAHELFTISSDLPGLLRGRARNDMFPVTRFPTFSHHLYSNPKP